MSRLMACGQENSSSAEILAVHEVNPDFEPPLIEKLDYNPKKFTFTWSGSFEELQSFCFKYLNIDPAECSITRNERTKSIKTSSLILNFYKTRTLQVQGSDSQNVKAQLQSILNATKANDMSNDEAVGDFTSNDKEPPISCPGSERSEGSVWQISSGDQAVSALDFKSEISKIWSQITLIHEKIGSFNKPREADLNNAQLINTLQQRNQNLCNEISILKERLLEETTKLKRISEERDSYITALQVLTKELRVDGTVALSSNADQATIHSAEATKRPRLNSQLTSQKIPVIATQNRFEPLQDQISVHSDQPSQKNRCDVLPKSTPSSNGERNKSTTVVIGDSMIKQIHGWKLGRKVGHRVVVKSFSGATCGDMNHYLQPTIDKDPAKIILHIGTNDLKDRDPNTVADHIVDLARKIENQSSAQVILSEVVSRSDDVSNESVKATNKKLRKFCTQNGWQLVQHNNISNNCLNKSGLHLNERGNNIMFNNFVKCLSASAHRSA